MSGWLTCAVHGRHWGVRGAAGLLPFTVTTSGPAVLLALRSRGTHQGGTWGTIGGAIEPGETPWEAAVREANEEAAGLELAEAEAAESHRYGCVSGWAYTTFPVRVPADAPVTDPFRLGDERPALGPGGRGRQLCRCYPPSPSPGRSLGKLIEGCVPE